MSKWYRVLCRRATGFVALTLTMALGCGCVDRFILRPPAQAMAVPGAARRLVNSGSGVVEVWVTRAASAPMHDRQVQGFVLQFAGNGTRAERAAGVATKVWRDYPVEVWTVNYPGFGSSTGPARLHKLPPAALAVYDELAGVARGRPIYLMGSSLGTAVALHVAANRPVAGMLLKNPLPLQQMIVGEYGWMTLWVPAMCAAMNVPPEMDSLANGEQARAPAIFVMAERDRVVRPVYQTRVLRAYAGEKRVIAMEWAGHGAPVQGAALEELSEGVKWLWEERMEGAAEKSQIARYTGAAGDEQGEER